MDFKELIGLIITGFTISPGKELLKLDTTTKAIWLRAEGDCCSESWFEHVETPKFPAKILSVEEKDLGDCPSDGTRQECDVKYSTILKTDQGDFEIEYRNSSNGYYGGYLSIEIKD